MQSYKPPYKRIKTVWVLGMLLSCPLVFSHDIYIPERIPDDFQLKNYEAKVEQGEHTLTYQKVATDYVWFVTRQESNLYVYHCELLSSVKKTDQRAPVCYYKSEPLPIASTVYRPGYNISSHPVSGGNLTVKLSGYGKEQLILAYGYDNDIKSSLDGGTFKVYRINYSNAKLPDYEFHGFILVGDFADKSNETASQQIRVTRYDGVALDGHSVVPKIVLRSNLAWDDESRETYDYKINELWQTFYSFLVFPKQHIYQTSLTDSQIQAEVIKRYQQVAKTKFATKQFNKAFKELKDFFEIYDFRQIDKEAENKAYLVCLKDYAYWLEKTGDPKQAVLVNKEILKRAPEEAVNYLILAKSQLVINNYADKEKDYYQKAAKDNFRQYCIRVLKEGNTFNIETEQLIKRQLGITELSIKNCMPTMDMIEAVKKGDINTVKTYLEQGVDVNALSNDGHPALVYAIYRNDLAMATFLLKRGADAAMVIKSQSGNSNGDMGLFAFAYSQLVQQSYNSNKAIDFKMADLLLANGADINCLYLNQSWPLLQATAYNDIRVVRYLLEKGANPNKVRKAISSAKIPLLEALSHRRYDVAKLLIEHGADVNMGTYTAVWSASYTKTVTLYPWETPLITLLSALDPLRSGKKQIEPEAIEILQLLLAKGADPTLGGPSASSEKPEHNGWQEVEKLVYATQSNEVGCLLEPYRPKDIELLKKSTSLCVSDNKEDSNKTNQ